MLMVTSEGMARVRELEEALRRLPQAPLQTEHVFHAGMYARTVRIPAGVALTSVLIKIETIVIVQGHLRVTIDDGAIDFEGYHVLRAAAGRKQAWLALSDSTITMIFPSEARTTEEAEAQFTDEAEQLLSRRLLKGD